ncbi:5-methylcytosine-specific restriction system specificity protein McrC [Corynebacterium imitans]|uniref:5-methylcytosine restriction system specificity protein McrC n=1 Tax=Corynebacterium imitans TaxID=156978 RepID=UPI001EF2F6A4|nr:5-methylcytosine-specific restriction system specificity protein McrC [Corynebacterium imitans]MCG7278486.1 5-methylcytosine-specific restriction system specificity protein McrC [Corynebacterium imitans]
MDNTNVLLGNVHVMMAYAFRCLERAEPAQGAPQEFDQLHDLLAHVIAEETARQIRRGLHHQYLPQREELRTIRGRVDIAATFTRQLTQRGTVVCDYEEFLADTAHNRAVYAVVLMLARHPQVAPLRRRALTRLLPYFAHVTRVPISTLNFEQLELHRANASYRWLLGACELAVKGLLPGDATGNAALPWQHTEAMSTLFENFVKEYFRFHHPQLQACSAQVGWDLRGERGVGKQQLPSMRTDITLTGPASTLIVDTKFYSEAMSYGRYDKASLHSGNLYQIHAYVRNAAAASTTPVGGLLLYARTDGPIQPELDVEIGGHRIGATTLDLATPWPHLQAQLEAVLDRFPANG